MKTPVDTFPRQSLHIGLSVNSGVVSDPVEVFRNIMSLTFSVLRNVQSEAILDKVAVVRGYAELWIKYQEISTFRQRLADSLHVFAVLLESDGANENAEQARLCATLVASVSPRTVVVPVSEAEN
jgi:hypothetical protein